MCKPVRVLALAVAVSLSLAASASAASLFYISGGGYGHGVGMSQYGAYGYALHGADYRSILADYYQGTTLGQTNPSRIVRVLLKTGSAAFSGATHAGRRRLHAGKSYTVRALANGELQLINSRGKRIGTFAAPLTVSGPGPVSVAGLGSYRGSLQFRPGAGGVETINAVGVDDYVRGVVAAEMPSSWPAQALAAQAVAARTFGLTSDVGGTAYNLYSDTRSQEYSGVAAETAATNAAVAATAGQIVTYNGAPATTYFFSSSGGYTEDVENAFPGATPAPWLRGVPDPYDGAEGHDPYHHWGQHMTMAAAQAKLSGLVKGTLEGIQVTRTGASPRILSAVVIGTGGRTNVTGAELQQRFGLLSTWASFTTVATAPGTAAAAIAGVRSGHTESPFAPGAAEASAYLRELLSHTALALAGTVVPGRKGAPLQIQRLYGNRWRTIKRLRLGPDGRYSVRVPSAGSYRVLIGGLPGPAVGVG